MEVGRKKSSGGMKEACGKIWHPLQCPNDINRSRFIGMTQHIEDMIIHGKSGHSRPWNEPRQIVGRAVSESLELWCIVEKGYLCAGSSGSAECELLQDCKAAMNGC